MNIPAWAQDIFVSKGLGFERIEVRYIVWDYFVLQFSQIECSESEYQLYFAAMVNTFNNDGSIEKARQFCRDSDLSFMRNPTPTPVRQSALTVFEEKMADYLQDD